MTDSTSYNSITFSTEPTFDPRIGGIVTKDFLQTPPSNASLSNIWHSAQSNQWVKMTTSSCADALLGLRPPFSNTLWFTNFTSLS